MAGPGGEVARQAGQPAPHFSYPPSPNWGACDVAAVSAAGLIVYCSSASVYFALVQKGAQSTQVPSIRGLPAAIHNAHQDRTACAAFLPAPLDFILVTGGDCVKFWDISSLQKEVKGGATPAAPQRFEAFHTISMPSKVLCLDTSPDGAIAAGDFSGNLLMCSVAPELATYLGTDTPGAETERLGPSSIIHLGTGKPSRCSATAVRILPAPRGHPLHGTVAVGSSKGFFTFARAGGSVLAMVAEHAGPVQGMAWRRTPVGIADLGGEVWVLATSAKDQRVIVWGCVSTEGGLAATKLRQLLLPNKWLPNRQSPLHGMQFLPLAFPTCLPPPFEGHLLVAIGVFGNVVLYNLNTLLEASSEEERKECKPQFTVVYGHGSQTVVYSVLATEGAIISIGRDRAIACSAPEKGAQAKRAHLLGGAVYSMDSNAKMAVLGRGDKAMSVTDEEGSIVDVVHGFRDRITAVAVHPDAASRVAFGLSSGEVGLLLRDLKKGAGTTFRSLTGALWGTQIFATKHKGPVYVLQFHRGVWNGAGLMLYSLGGDGMIYEHVVKQPGKGAVNVTTRLWHLKRTALTLSPESVAHVGESLPSTFQFHTEAIGAPGQRPDADGGSRILTIGYKDGRVDIFRVFGPLLRNQNNVEPQLLHTFQYHTDKVTSVAFNGTTVASTSTDGTVKVIAVLEQLVTPFQEKGGDHIPPRTMISAAPVREGKHAAAVMSAKWMPGSMTTVATSSYDCTVQLWGLTDESLEPLCNLRHHSSRVFGLTWLGEDRLLTGGDDNSYHVISAGHALLHPPFRHPPEDFVPPPSSKKDSQKRERDEGEEGASTPEPEEVSPASKREKKGDEQDPVVEATQKIFGSGALAAQRWLDSGGTTEGADLHSASTPEEQLVDSLSAGAAKSALAAFLEELPPDATPYHVVGKLVEQSDPLSVALAPAVGPSYWKDLLGALASSRPGSPLLAACCYAAAGQVEQAVQVLSNGGYPYEACLMAWSHSVSGCPPHLDAVFQRAAQRTDGWDALEPAIFLLGAGNSEGALMLLEQATDAPNLLAACRLAELRLLQGEPSKRAQRLQMLQRCRDRYAAAWCLLDQHATYPTPKDPSSGGTPHPLVLARLASQLVFEEGLSREHYADDLAEDDFEDCRRPLVYLTTRMKQLRSLSSLCSDDWPVLPGLSVPVEVALYAGCYVAAVVEGVEAVAQCSRLLLLSGAKALRTRLAENTANGLASEGSGAFLAAAKEKLDSEGFAMMQQAASHDVVKEELPKKAVVTAQSLLQQLVDDLAPRV